MSRIRWYGPSMVLLVTVLACLIGGPAAMRSIAWSKTDAQIKMVRNDLTPKKMPALAELDSAFTKVAKSVEPSVVYIEILAKHPPQRQDLLQKFFGPNNPFGNPQENNGQQNNKNGMDKYNALQPIGSGSGWIYDDKGHIITNNHVVEHADELIVKFHDGTKEVAKVVGTDPDTDVAVIQVQRKDLHPAEVSNKPVEQGDIVFAFGSPFEFQFSMSMGIVSAKGRQLGIVGEYNKKGEFQPGYENFIQTDAAINPGNSGGPLTNVYGQVVGMNSAIASKTGQNNGLGFAIPVNMVVNVAKQLIHNKNHRVIRGYLGVYINDLDQKMAKTFGYSGKGVLVVNPIPGSPADKAGLKAGDIITKIDGQDVRSAKELRYLIAGDKPGTKISVTVFRNGKTMAPMDLTLGTLPTQMAGGESNDQGNMQPQMGNKGVAALRKWGIANMATFTQAMAQQLGVTYHAGVLVKAVRQDSIADSAGLTQGTIIEGVMGHKVTDVSELSKVIQKYDLKNPIRLRVLQYNPMTKQFMPTFIVMDLSNMP